MNPSIVLGTFQNNNYQDLLNVVDAAFEKGCTAFDTAPSYGTETDLGKAIASCMSKYHVDREKVFVSDKVDAWQMIQGKGDVSSYIHGISRDYPPPGAQGRPHGRVEGLSEHRHAQG